MYMQQSRSEVDAHNPHREYYSFVLADEAMMTMFQVLKQVFMSYSIHRASQGRFSKAPVNSPMWMEAIRHHRLCPRA